MSKKPTFALHSYPWYIADWRDSETRIEMNLAERGLYRDLLDYCYREGSIPDDTRKLVAIAGCAEQEFTLAWPAVERQFIKTGAGRLENLRVNEVLPELERFHEQRRKAGQVSGLNRRNRKSKSSDSRSTSVPTPVEREREPSTSSSAAPSTSSSSSGKSPEPATTTKPFAASNGKTKSEVWWTAEDVRKARELLEASVDAYSDVGALDPGVVLEVLRNVDGIEDLKAWLAASQGILGRAKTWGRHVVHVREWPAQRPHALAHAASDQIAKRPRIWSPETAGATK